jgi:hypothetical protein
MKCSGGECEGKEEKNCRWGEYEDEEGGVWGRRRRRGEKRREEEKKKS